jgi:hypothetical protein
VNIDSFFANANNRIEHIKLAYGTVYNFTNVLATDSANTVYSVNGYAQLNEDVTGKIRLLNRNDGTNNYQNKAVSVQALHGTASIDASGDIVYTSKTN